MTNGSDKLVADARDLAGRGARLTLVGQLVRTGCNLLGLLVLARLLTPHDYGLVAMVVAIVGLGEVLRDMGLSTAAVQAPTLTERQRSNLFWMSAGIGFALCLAVAFSSPYLATLYGEPAITGIACGLSTTFLLNGLAAQHRANANRKMQFGRLVLIDTVPPVASLILAIGLALVNAGAWALVGQQVATAAIGLALSWLLVRWLPKLPSRGAGMRPFIGFGAPLVGAQILGYVSRSVDTAIMGLRFGPSLAGLYDRAFQIVMLPIGQFAAPSTRVALPALARHHSDPATMGRLLRKGQAALLYPVGGLLALILSVAPTGIPLLLGEQWQAAVPFVQVLSLGALAQTLAYPSYWAFLSYGQTKANFTYSLVSRPIVIGAILIGSQFGPIWISIGYSAGLIAIWPLACYWIRNFPGVDALRLVWDGAWAVVTYFPAVGVSIWLGAVLSDAGAGLATSFFVGVAAFIVVASIAVLALPRARDAFSLIGRRFIRSRSGA